MQIRRPMIVAAGLVRKEGRILLAQRKKGSFRGMLWEFPGGKIRYGETLEDCLARELMEELGINVAVKGVYGVNSHVYADAGRNVVIMLLECVILSGMPKPLECKEVRWVTPKELGEYELVEADRPFAERLIQEAGL